MSTLLRKVCVNPPLNFKLVTTFGWYTVSVPPVGVMPIAGAALELSIAQRFPPPETEIPNPGEIVTPPVPAGACIVSASPLVLVVKPVNSRDVGVYETESRDTARGCKVQLISLPIIDMFWPGVKLEFELVTVTVPKLSDAENPMRCNVVGVVLAALSRAIANEVPGSPWSPFSPWMPWGPVFPGNPC